MDPSRYGSSAGRSSTTNPTGFYHGTVKATVGDTVTVQVPRLFGGASIPNIPVVGAMPSVDDAVFVSFIEGRRGSLLAFSPDGGGGGGGSSVTVSDDAPTSPSPDVGDLWYESDTGKTFVYYDSGWVEIGGAAATPRVLEDADADTKIQVEESGDEDQIRFDTAGSERMVIDASGNVTIGASDFTVDTDTLYVDAVNDRVGIGTTSPAESLSVDGNVDMVGTGRTIRFGQAASEGGPHGLEWRPAGTLTSALYYRTSPQSWSFEDGSGNDIAEFYSGTLSTAFDTDTLYVDGTNDRVGINTASPGAALDIHGNSRIAIDVSDATYPKIGNYYSSSDNLEIGSFGGIDFAIDTINNTSEVFNWRSGGSAGAGSLLMQLNEAGELSIGGNGSVAGAHLHVHSQNRAVSVLDSGVNNYAELGFTGQGGTGPAYGYLSGYGLLFRTGTTRGGLADRMYIEPTGATRFYGDVVPNSDSSYDLGSTSLRWSQVHGDRYYVNDTDTYIEFEADGGSGVDGPGIKFMINGSEMFKFARENNNSQHSAILFGENNDAIVYHKDDEYFAFWPSGNERMRLRNNNTGLTGASSRGLSVRTGGAAEIWRESTGANDGILALYSNNGSTTDLQWLVYGDGDTASDTGSYGTISDNRLKTNITQYHDPTDDLMAINVIKYDLSKTSTGVDENGDPIIIDRDESKTMTGWEAQQVQSVKPGFVKLDSERGILSVKSSVFTPLLHRGFQVHEEKIQALQAENDELRARIEALEAE